MRELNTSDFVTILQKFLPTGAAWPRIPGANITRLLAALARLATAFDLRLQILHDELNPATSLELLPDWEAFTAACDICCIELGTVEERRSRVLSKLAEQGSLSRSYFLALAQEMTYKDTSITEFRPTHCEMTCAAAVRDIAWRFAWEVNLPHQGDNPPVTEMLSPTNCETNCDARLFDVPWPEIRYIEAENHRSFRAGSRCDERIDSYLFGSLECQFMRLKPAHTHVIFTYRGLPDEAH